MERHNSNLCFNGFSIGHMLNFPIPSTPVAGESEEQELEPSQLAEKGVLSSCFSSFGEEEEDKVQTNRSSVMADHEFSVTVDNSSFVVQDRESETESSRNPTRKRSKRFPKPSCFPSAIGKDPKKQKPSQPSQSLTEPEPLSSVSDVTTEEHLAFSLMMLSRDKNPKKHGGDDVESDKNGTQGNHKCETCNRVFKSYQGLGGHRASHKKTKSSARKIEQENGLGDGDKKIHKCPVCFRVFSSGQALGGHKRSHGTLLTKTNQLRNSRKERIIDLNLPAPCDYEEADNSFG